MSNITIQVNHEAREVAEGTTLAALLAAMELPAEGTACAVNETIVPKSKWSEYKLQAGMNVDIFSLVAGG